MPSHVPSRWHPTVSKHSLNDVAAMLVLAGTDELSQRALRAALSGVARDTSLPDPVRELMNAARDRLKAAKRGTLELALDEIRHLVESAQRQVETGERMAMVMGDDEETSRPAFDRDILDARAALLPPDVEASLLGDFIAESREMLQYAESGLLQLESNPDDTEAINTVFRAFHTIKGTSAFFSLDHVTDLAHHAETVLSRIRDREIRCVGGYAALAFRSCDMLRTLVDATQGALEGHPAGLPENYDSFLALLRDPESAGISETGNWPGDADAQTPGSARRDAGEIDDESRAPERRAAPRATTGVGVEPTMRVRTERLDRLIEMVGELVIAETMISQDPLLKHERHAELNRKVQHADKIVRELQDLSMAMRMVPLRAQFQRVARLVRDLGTESGKRIQFIGAGQETEIDRNMVDALADPLVHLVRNCVDHGIEPPAERRAAGKAETGTVRLSAYHAGGNVVVELTDDGRGLDRVKIVRRAIADGRIASGDAMSDRDLWELIFAPGFSTAELVTDVSGRGVGMDVVRRNIETLRGRVDIQSTPGVGTTFAVRVPLTLAITDGMLVRVGSERYVVPTLNIQLSFRPVASMLSTVSGRGEMVMLRNDIMPLVRLHRLFDIAGAIEDPTEALLMVVGDGAQRTALLVDELIGQQQVVAKSLGDGIGRIPAVSGGAVLGDGRVGLILDVNELLSLARHGDGAVFGAFTSRAVA